MGYQERIHFEGAVFHVMNHGVNDQDVFLDDQDRTNFLTTLDRVLLRTGSELFAFCLMNNHFHLVLKVRHCTVTQVMQRLETSYALVFNRRHERKGHLFQARFAAKLCDNERYLGNAIFYVHDNPVHHGFRERAEDWRWSSIHVYRGQDESLVRLSRTLPTIPDLLSPDFEPWDKNSPGSEREPALQRSEEHAHGLAAILQSVARERHVALEELFGRSRRVPLSSIRREFAQRAISAGHSQAEIARALRKSEAAVSQLLKELKD